MGITGAPGSGKTTLATAVVRALAGRPDWRGTAVAYVPMDGFHLADAELDRLGRRDRKGAPDTFDAAGYAALLRRVVAGEPAWAPAFERDLEQPIAQSLPIGPQVHTVVTEGNYLLLDDDPWPAVRSCLSETWFCAIPADIRLERLVARHERFGKTPAEAREWVARVDEPNAARVFGSASLADIVVTTG